MTTCTSCGSDVTGKKFCPECGTPVQPKSTPMASTQLASPTTCPRCNGEVKPGAAFCMHCGSALSTPTAITTPPPPLPATHSCPVCHAQVPVESAFCVHCGHNMRAAAPQMAPAASAVCTNCGRQNASGMRFCANCGSPIGATPPPAVQPNYGQSGQYPQPSQYPQSQQYPPQPQYQQPYGQPQYPQQYGQSQYPQQYTQAGYQPQPMMGQQPMVLRCPVCMAMAPMGTPTCPSCRTSLAGVVPTPATMPAQGQQGGLGGFLQGDNGKLAMGALGGAAAVIGGEMLLHGLENKIEGDVEGDMGMGYGRHHGHHHRDEGLLGDVGEIARDIGLF